MTRPAAILLLLFLPASGMHGQTPVGSWSEHLSSHSAMGITSGTRDIYVSTGSSVIIYNRQYDELRKLSRVSGLTETSISAIAWSEEGNTLVIGYSSSNVDLVSGTIVFNMPEIFNSSAGTDKRINRIRTLDTYAYLACSFGIVVIDIRKREVRDTWKPAFDEETNEVLDIAFGNGDIYAATATGIFRAPLPGQGLSYFGNWSRINTLPEPSGRYNALAFTGSYLYANRRGPGPEGDTIYSVIPAAGMVSYIPGIVNYSMDAAADGFTVASGESVRYFGTEGTLRKTILSYGFAAPRAREALADNGDIWIADTQSGLVRSKNTGEFTTLNLPGPLSDNASWIATLNGVTVICGGGTDESWNPLKRPYQVSLSAEKGWSGLTREDIHDPVRALIDPADKGHYFIASWGGGLLEYRDAQLIHTYNDSNSPLQSVIPGMQYVRICGMAMDDQGYLWIAQSGVEGSIKILKPGGTWIVNPVTIDAPVIGDIIITRDGYKWMTLPGGYGLFILDDNKTPENPNDDRHKRLIVRDTENQLISSVNSIAEDLSGNIWIGTEQGPMIYYNTGKVFTEDLRAVRIKIPRNDGSGLSDYLLKTETITAIFVDGSDRKWLGTSGSGAFYVSSDGATELKRFSTSNSPLLSDSIASISVDNMTGDVWFGTSLGSLSYRNTATEGSTGFTSVYAFPNPVREDFTGSVTITGLMADTRVIITDISGNLVYRTVSEGGQATWDLTTYNGKQVTTGVYLIFCASSDGSEAFVTKILVIRK